jgi:hypothetical protein
VGGGDGEVVGVNKDKQSGELRVLVAHEALVVRRQAEVAARGM